jgi:hypothetical protein
MHGSFFTEVASFHPFIPPLSLPLYQQQQQRNKSAIPPVLIFWKNALPPSRLLQVPKILRQGKKSVSGNIKHRQNSMGNQIDNRLA